MNDDRLRALERRWQETGSNEDELAWDLERERLGLPPRVTVVEVELRNFDVGDPALSDRSGREAWEAAIVEATRRPCAPWLLTDWSRVLGAYESTAMIDFFEAHKRLEPHGGGVVLCAIPARVWGVFQLAGHEDLLPVSASVEDCLDERGWVRRGRPLAIELRSIL
jgi:hypothetical protein